MDNEFTEQNFQMGFLQLQKHNEVMTIRFRSEDVPGFFDFQSYREDILRLLTQHECEAVLFDLHAVLSVPSSFLSLLVTIQSQGFSVRLDRPSPILREKLQRTGLDQLLAGTFEEHDPDEPH